MPAVASTRLAPGERYLARRRWARVGWIYGSLLLVGLLFIGPFFISLTASLKDNPLEWPFRFQFPQVSPQNWSAAWRLGIQGANDPWLGGWTYGSQIGFEVAYFVPRGTEPTPPQITIPRRKPGAGQGAVIDRPYAADYSEASMPQEIERKPFVYKGESGQLVRYRFQVAYARELPNPEPPEAALKHVSKPRIDRLPADLESPRGQIFISATLDPNRLERRGRVASWDNLTPGYLGYTFRNYVRVFTESRSLETGRSLFLSWTLNTFYFAFVRVLLTLLFASMAGYALARLYLPGKQWVFLLILFGMMVPAQVTFISNYLVLKDGIFGFTNLFGVSTLLGSISGLILVGAIGIDKVFIMKQFFESIPRELEEAALIDGASTSTTFFRIILPLATPALGALTILTFQGAWNEFFWALVILSTGPQNAYSLPLGLYSFRNAYGQVGDWGLILAGSFLSMVPIIILFAVFQRYFVESVSFSGLKG